MRQIIQGVNRSLIVVVVQTEDIAPPPAARYAGAMRRRKLLLVIIGSLAIAVGSYCLERLQPKNGPPDGYRVEQLEPDLKRSVPLGASRSEAAAWFAAHRLSPSKIM